MMPHSSSDNHLRYRSQGELDAEKESDPLPRFQNLLVSAGLLDGESDQVLRDAVDQEVESAIEYADAAPPPDPETALTGVYAP